MKTREIDLLNFLEKENRKLTRQELKKGSGINVDVSFMQTLKDLIYLEYVEKDENSLYSRTKKPYNNESRSKEAIPVNYKYLFNKIFSGSYLNDNLGHEIINFIKDDTGKRYIYLNPWGETSNDCINETKYVFHIIESAVKADSRVYELVAVSEVDNDESRKIHSWPIFNGYKYNEIFDDSTKAKFGVSLVCKNFYVPNGCRIFIQTACENADINENKTWVKVMSNPQHSISYALGKKTINSKPKFTDFDVLEQLLNSNSLVLDNDYNINLEKTPAELPYSVISGRVALEVSMSNLLSYFLNRDKELMRKFVSEFLEVKTTPEYIDYQIIREKEKNIDLLFKSEHTIMVVENKIDSDINGVKETTNSLKASQLSKYYQYVVQTYPEKIPYFFILVPEYNGIDDEYLSTFECGDKYVLKTYTELYELIKDHEYKPNGKIVNNEQMFAFEQFKTTIQYLTWSKARQQENTAYIRMKQIIDAIK